MLGLGNALTRSINFGKIGAASIFNNAPATGSFYEGGYVVGVQQVDSADGNALIYVAYPTDVQYEITSNGEQIFVDTETISNAKTYIKDNLEILVEGSVYDDWEMPSFEDFEFILDYVKDSDFEGWFLNKYKSGIYAAPSVQYLTASLDNVSVRLYDTRSMFDGVYYVDNASTYSNNVSVLAIKKVYVTLQVNEKINPAVLQTKPIDSSTAGGNDFQFDISLSNINQNSFNISKDITDQNTNSLGVSVLNGHISVSLNKDFGAILANDLIQQKVFELPDPWRTLSQDIYAVFELFNAGVSDDEYDFSASTNTVPFNDEDIGFFDVSNFTSDFGVIRQGGNNSVYCYAKVKKIDGQKDLGDSKIWIQPYSVIADVGDDFSNLNTYISYYFEIDVTTFLVTRLLNDIINNTNFYDFSQEILSEGWYFSNYTSSIYDAHVSLGGDFKIPTALWWSRFSIGNLRFVSNSMLPSDKIVTPPTLQNIIVPLVPEQLPYASDKGERLDNNLFNIPDFLDSSKVVFVEDGTIEGKGGQVGVIKRAFSTSAERDAYSSDPNAFPPLEVGMYVAVSNQTETSITNGGTSGVYSWNGSGWDKYTPSVNDYFNYKGYIYIYKNEVTDVYSRFIDSDIITY